MEWWQREPHAGWEEHLHAAALRGDTTLRAATYAGRPFGSDDFLRDTAEKLDRHWIRGRPKKKPLIRPSGPDRQFSLS
jgi:hypothetical protein